MATEKKQSFLGGAAVLAFGIVAVKIIGAVFKIPLRNILGEGGSADFSNAYNIYATMLTISTAGLPVALSKLVSEAYARDDFEMNVPCPAAEMLFLRRPQYIVDHY